MSTTITRCQICMWDVNNEDTEHDYCVPGGYFVRVLRRYFTEDDIYEGDVNYQREEWDETPCRAGDPVDFVVSNLILTGAIEFSGNDWWSDPDGSYIVDYSDGMRCETNVFPVGFTTAQINDINARLNVRS